MYIPQFVIQCPKCRAKYPDLLEIWEGHVIAFDFDGEAYLEGVKGPGFPQKVEGDCRECKHRWTFRAKALDDLINLTKDDTWSGTKN